MKTFYRNFYQVAIVLSCFFSTTVVNGQSPNYTGGKSDARINYRGNTDPKIEVPTAKPLTPSGTKNSGGGCEQTVSFTNVNLAIPDGNPGGDQDIETVSTAPGTTLGVDVLLKSVCVTITHTWVGDLKIMLFAPNGTFITLLDRPGIPVPGSFGCDGNDIDACFESGTGNDADTVCLGTVPTITGTYTAEIGFDLYDINVAGGTPNGDWTLFVSDNVLADQGTLVAWSLVFYDGPSANWNAPDEACSTLPALNLNNFIVGTTGGTWSGTGVTGNFFDPAGLSGPVAITYAVTNVSQTCSDTLTQIINVISATPTAAFTLVPVGETIVLTNGSTDANTYDWDFGDTNSSSDENPSHTYSSPGTYTVTLTAFNACGTDVTSTTVTIVACTDPLLEGGFEGGPQATAWTQTSTNFGTPICDDPTCNAQGVLTGPYKGAFWAFFGGALAFEEGSLTQQFNVAAGNNILLSFWLEVANCDSAIDFLKIAVDADTLFTVTGADPICGQTGYKIRSVNLDAYADGANHTLKFFSRQYFSSADVTNFFVDDIKLNVCPFIGLAETNSKGNINLMPNPANEYLDVVFNNVSNNTINMNIIDISGRTVMTEEIHNVSGPFTKRLSIEQLSNGVYFIRCINGDETFMARFVKQ